MGTRCQQFKPVRQSRHCYARVAFAEVVHLDERMGLTAGGALPPLAPGIRGLNERALRSPPAKKPSASGFGPWRERNEGWDGPYPDLNLPLAGRSESVAIREWAFARFAPEANGFYADPRFLDEAGLQGRAAPARDYLVRSGRPVTRRAHLWRLVPYRRRTRHGFGISIGHCPA